MKPIDLLTNSPFAKLVEDEKEKEISLESLKQDEIVQKDKNMRSEGGIVCPWGEQIPGVPIS